MRFSLRDAWSYETAPSCQSLQLLLLLNVINTTLYTQRTPDNRLIIDLYQRVNRRETMRRINDDNPSNSNSNSSNNNSLHELLAIID